MDACKAQTKERLQSLGYCHIQRPASKYRIYLEKRRYLCIMESVNDRPTAQNDEV